jgi:hypothetical protein
MAQSAALLLAGLASTGAQTYGAYSASKAQSTVEQSQLKMNARLAELQGMDAKRRGDLERGQISLRAADVKAGQRAAYAASGVKVGSGSALDAELETDYLESLDLAQAKQNSYLEALGFQTQADRARSAAKYAKLGARNEQRDTLVTGGLQAARQVGQFAYTEGQRKKPEDTEYKRKGYL